MRVERKNVPSGLLVGAVLIAMSACWMPTNATQDQEEPVEAPDSIVEVIVHSRRSPASWDIYIADEPGGAPRRLTDDPALDYNAVFSPDGRWVVFTSERAGSAELYALDLGAGSDPVRLTNHSAMDDAAAFSPDGERIAFVSTRDGDADIFVMPFSPGDATAEDRAVNLTRRPGGDFRPAFSPDGRRIAFSRQPCLWDAEGWHCEDLELCVMNADGSEVRQLPRTRAGIPADIDKNMALYSGGPAWSLDGAALYYHYTYVYYVDPEADDRAPSMDALEAIWGGPQEIRRFSLADEEDAFVAQGGYSPVVQSDGRVAFVHQPDGDGPASGRVFSVAADGSDQRAEHPALDPPLDCWSPDFDRGSGRMVCHAAGPDAVEGPEAPPGAAFASAHGAQRAELANRTVEIHSIRGNFPALTPEGEVLSTLEVRSLMEAEAGRLEDMTVPLHVSAIDGTGLREVFTPTSGIAWGADVARDAGWIVVGVGPTFGALGSSVDIWRMRVDGSRATNLTPSSSGNAAFPSISADGRRIVFRAPRNLAPGEQREQSDPGEMAIFVMDGDGKDLRRLTTGSGRETASAISPDGEWVAYVVITGYGAETKIWLSRVDGSEQRLLEPDREHITDRSMHPKFSPDGEWVVFTSDRGGLNDEWLVTPGPETYGELYAVPVSGGQAVRLTHDKWTDGPSDWGVRAVARSRTLILSERPPDGDRASRWSRLSFAEEQPMPTDSGNSAMGDQPGRLKRESHHE